ncbi:rhomboid family intramembrane serine protease [Chitinophaga silvatica]|uniref:Rhomboid family intramembrane serine protease n=1 Tax=Chitinophaga silvatica TaxID=2282649 RepID=A0A3E1Y3S8_9BACT|nr:rhomboid family intramembrane serine protease [Chitinophaga silvatica]RFS19147.1 rhomboid family intramembrane serine protease [Chitinophaga silvatica]
MSLSISIIIIIFTCLVSIPAFSNHNQLYKLSLQPYLVKNNREYYRFLTSGFVHADYGHLFFNMLTLYFFGDVAEGFFLMYFNSKFLYILYYVLAIIVANMPSFFKHRNDPNYISLGASGAISAIVFTAILLHPWATISLFFAIRMPAVLYGVLFLVISAYLSRKGGGNINHDAHLWGAVFGIVFPLIFHPDLASDFIYQITHH